MTEYAPAAARALASSARGLAPTERISFLGDEWWMVRAGRHTIDVYLDIATAMSGEDTAAVLDVMEPRLSTIGDSLVAASDRGRYEAWIRERFGPALQHVGLPGDDHDDENRQGLRSTLLSLVGVTGNDSDVQRRARELAERYIVDRSAVPPSLAAAVLKVAAVAGDRALYEQYLAQLAQLGSQPEEYYRFFNALPWFRDPSLVHRTLELTLTPTVRSQDVAALLGGLMATPWGDDAAWTFTTSQWSRLTAKLDPFEGIPNTIKGMGAFCSEARAGEMKAFFARNPPTGSQRTAQQQIEKVERCAALRTRAEPAIARWLAQRAATAGTTAAPGPDNPRRPARP
jgi:hypothetical protein